MLPLLKQECVLDGIHAGTKEDVLIRMGSCLEKAGYIKDRALFEKDLREREKKFPTYIGYGMGLPHCVSNGVGDAGLCIAKLDEPVKWSDRSRESEAGFIIMLVANGRLESENVAHLKLLSNLAVLLMHDDFRESLREGSAEEIYRQVTEMLGGPEAAQKEKQIS